MNEESKGTPGGSSLKTNSLSTGHHTGTLGKAGGSSGSASGASTKSGSGGGSGEKPAGGG